MITVTMAKWKKDNSMSHIYASQLDEVRWFVLALDSSTTTLNYCVWWFSWDFFCLFVFSPTLTQQVFSNFINRISFLSKFLSKFQHYSLLQFSFAQVEVNDICCSLLVHKFSHFIIEAPRSGKIYPCYSSHSQQMSKDKQEQSKRMVLP